MAKALGVILAVCVATCAVSAVVVAAVVFALMRGLNAPSRETWDVDAVLESGSQLETPGGFSEVEPQTREGSPSSERSPSRAMQLRLGLEGAYELVWVEERGLSKSRLREQGLFRVAKGILWLEPRAAELEKRANRVKTTRAFGAKARQYRAQKRVTTTWGASVSESWELRGPCVESDEGESDCRYVLEEVAHAVTP